jgi:hypothetical protein
MTFDLSLSEPAGSRSLHRLVFGVFGSFGFRRFGILLLRLNLPEFVTSPSGFKALQSLFGIVTDRGQGQCPVLNFEEDSDSFADAISLGWRTTFDGGV